MRLKLKLIIQSLCIFCITASSLDCCEFTMARLQYDGGGDWYANPSSLPNLVTYIKEKTALAICDTIATVTLLDDGLFRFPFLAMTGHGIVHFTQAQRTRLRHFLENGGFLWADDNYGMDESFRKEMAILFPENPLIELNRDHPIYRSTFVLSGLPKIHHHDGKPAQGFGIYFNGRLVVFYTYSSDIGDGMEDLDVHNDGPQLHELALKMGTNIVSWFFNPR